MTDIFNIFVLVNFVSRNDVDFGDKQSDKPELKICQNGMDPEEECMFLFS